MKMEKGTLFQSTCPFLFYSFISINRRSDEQVDPHYHVPFRAVGLVCFTVVLLSLINIGSSTALSAIMALTTSTLLISYLIPIAMMVIRRLQQGGTSQSGREKIVFGPWTLGRWGLFINIYAIIFGLFVAIFVPFPITIPVTAENMNYSGPVFVGFLLVLLIDWLIRGRGRYTGPLKELIQSSTL
jgi:choline transport protein